MNISSRMLTRPGQSAKMPAAKATARIRQDIAHTREQLAGSVEALGNKLGGSARVKEAAVGRIRQPVKTVRQRPVPAAAVVLGVLVVLRLLLHRARN